PTEWTAESGQWTPVGVGDEQHSIHGFFLRGESAQTALITSGEWFWEEYTVSVAVRLESAATCGLCALKQANNDFIAFVMDSRPKPWPTMRLLRRVEGRDSSLGERAAALTPQQWYRLALRVCGGKIEAMRDGDYNWNAPTQRCVGAVLGYLWRVARHGLATC
ncbi:MAG: hypothetical protein ACUVX8_09760, partial [Candidatus Zipacnadales bacterium]